MRSRLSRTTESKTKKQLMLSIAGIIIVIFVLMRYGIPALTNLSLFLSKNNGVSQQDVANSKTVLTPPILSESFTATNSATITVSGSGVAKQTIQLYVNDTLV